MAQFEGDSTGPMALKRNNSDGAHGHDGEFGEEESGEDFYIAEVSRYEATVDRDLDEAFKRVLPPRFSLQIFCAEAFRGLDSSDFWHFLLFGRDGRQSPQTSIPQRKRAQAFRADSPTVLRTNSATCPSSPGPLPRHPNIALTSPVSDLIDPVPLPNPSMCRSGAKSDIGGEKWRGGG